MLKKVLILFTFFLLLKTHFTSAQDWSQNIASIFYDKCTSCHNPAGIAPFSLIGFTNAYNKRNLIEDAVSTGEMPPWPPDPGYVRFAHERTLSTQELNDIVSWVQNGAIPGDTTLAPPPPTYSGQAEIINPDLVARMPNYTVNTVDDLYRCFVIPSGLSGNKYITELEAIPGNRGIVHHILIYEDTTNTPLTLDANDPGPGYTNFGGTGSAFSKLIGIWVPGQQVFRLPPSMGIELRANTNIILQIHYPGGTFAQTDSTEIRFKLVSAPMREVSIAPPLNHFQLDNGPLYIPANTVRTFTAHYNLPAEVSVLGIGPHMHLIGTSISSFAVTPGNDTVPLISIPEWDFHWQGLYTYPRVLHLPAGSVLYSFATYDNTVNNPNNPNNPPQAVALGEATTDEMMLIYFSYTPYLPGDENIIQDSAIVLSLPEVQDQNQIRTIQFYQAYPNPARNIFNIEFYLPEKTSMSINLLDESGRTVKVILPFAERVAGMFRVSCNAEGLSSGKYYLQLKSKDFVKTQTLLIGF